MNKKYISTYPRFIQGSDQPAFEGLGTDDFVCSNCGNILAKNLDTRSLAAVDIECRACGVVTRTASWPDNETMPFHILLLSLGKKYLLNTPLKLNNRLVITCEQEVARIKAITGSKKAGNDLVTLSHEVLDTLVLELNIYTNGDFEKNLTRTLNARKKGNMRFLDFPLAWAIAHLRARLDENFIDVQSIDKIAIQYLQQYRETNSRWKHHPLFTSIVRAICSEFHHFITMLITACYLEDSGNRIGLTDSESAKGRSPDLYINTELNERVSIEVKAPKVFLWPQENKNSSEFERSIFSALQSARGQITGSSGLVVIGANSLSPDFEELFKKAIVKVLQEKNISSRIEAVISVVHVSSSPLEMDHQISSFSNFDFHKNPRFTGVAAIRQPN